MKAKTDWAEIYKLSKQIKTLAQEYKPTRERIYFTHPEMKRFKFGIINVPFEKLCISIDIVIKNRNLLNSYGFLWKPENEAKLMILENNIARKLPDSFIEACYRRAGLTWFTFPETRLTLISYLGESELVNLFLDGKFQSDPDRKNKDKKPVNTEK